MAKKSLLTLDGIYRRVKKQHLTVNGVYRKVNKIYETVNGVYVLRWKSGDTWKKYNASRSVSDGLYKKYDFLIGTADTVGGYYGNPVSIALYEGYTFSERHGFWGENLRVGGLYRVDSRQVVYKAIEFVVDENKSTKDNIYVDIKFECVDAALYYVTAYSYDKGSYIEDVIADEGKFPTTATPEKTEDNGNRIYVEENGLFYCYEKVTESEPVLAVLDEAILDSSTLS